MKNEKELKEVALIEVTPDLIKHQRAVEIMDIAQRLVKENSMRWQINELTQAVDVMDKLVIPLNRVYDKLKNAIDYGVEDVLYIPDLSDMTLDQLIDLKAQMSKATSGLDKQITAVRNRKS